MYKIVFKSTFIFRLKFDSALTLTKINLDILDLSAGQHPVWILPKTL